MTSTSYRDALEVLHTHGKTLRANDFNSYNFVFILHEEGTTLLYRSAFLVEWKDWVFVYTEHHGEMAYHKTDLGGYWNLHADEEKPKLHGTGHTDRCEECCCELPVEVMNYDTHPDCDKYEEGHLVILCDACVEKYRWDDGDLPAPDDPV